MGSIEVYDYKQQKWVPYVPDPEKWYQHFKDLRDGYVRPDHKGRYIVGSGAINRKLKELEKQQQQQPQVNLVTPVAQATEIARSEVKRKKEETELGKKSGKKRKNSSAPLFKSPKKTKFADPDLQL